MFARGVVYLHAAHLPVPKTLSAKSSVSISSKLIEIKGLQLQHFGHLRKTGGRGSYRLVHTPYLPLRKPHGTKSNHSRTLALSACVEGYEPLPRKSNYSRTYAIPRGWGVWSYQRASDRCHWSLGEERGPWPVVRCPPCRGWARPSRSSLSCPLSLSSHSTPRLLRLPFPKRNLLVSPLFQGARPAGMSPFVYRCPDAHD